MPSKTTHSYVIPGIFLAIMLVVFILGVWIMYVRSTGWRQGALNEEAAALQPFDLEAAGREAAKELGTTWPAHGPKTAVESLEKKIKSLLAEPPEGQPKLDRKALEDKYYAEAGYKRDANGAWRPLDSMVKELLEKKHQAFLAKRTAEIEVLRKKHDLGGIFKLEAPKPEEQ